MAASLDKVAGMARVGAPPEGSQPQGELTELESVARMAAVMRATAELGWLEAKLALGSVATALLLLAAAAAGALSVCVMLVITVVLSLHALGLDWISALAITSLLTGLSCLAAARRSGTLLRGLTLPQTRDALRTEPES